MTKQTEPNKLPETEDELKEITDVDISAEVKKYLDEKWNLEGKPTKTLDEYIFNLVNKSDGKVNKYGIPTAVEWSDVEEKAVSEELGREIEKVIREALIEAKDSGEYEEELTEEQIDEIYERWISEQEESE